MTDSPCASPIGRSHSNLKHLWGTFNQLAREEKERMREELQRQFLRHQETVLFRPIDPAWDSDDDDDDTSDVPAPLVSDAFRTPNRPTSTHSCPGAPVKKRK